TIRGTPSHAFVNSHEFPNARRSRYLSAILLHNAVVPDTTPCFTAPFDILNATINHYRAKGGTDRPRFTILLLSRCPRKRLRRRRWLQSRYSPAASYCIAEEMVAQENIRAARMDIRLGPPKNSRDLDAFTDSRRFPAGERKQPGERLLSRDENGRVGGEVMPLITMLAGRKWKLIPTRDINNLQQFRGKKRIKTVYQTVVGSSHTQIDCVRQKKQLCTTTFFVIKVVINTLESTARGSIRDGCVTALLVTHGPKRLSLPHSPSEAKRVSTKRAPQSLQWQWREAPESPLSAGVQRLTSP
ncbi:hypothetical protein ALC56_13161, partial [Trachymyrmex septentrionalis]